MHEPAGDRLAPRDRTGPRHAARRVAQVSVRAAANGIGARVVVVNRRFIDAAHRNGLDVHVWTIDDPAEMHRLLDLGVDGIMTDRPEALRSVLVERGQWHDAPVA